MGLRDAYHTDFLYIIRKEIYYESRNKQTSA